MDEKLELVKIDQKSDLNQKLQEIVDKNDVEFWQNHENNDVIFNYCLLSLEFLFDQKITPFAEHSMLYAFNHFLNYIKPFINCYHEKFLQIVSSIVLLVFCKLCHRKLDRFHLMNILQLIAQFCDFIDPQIVEKASSSSSLHKKFTFEQFHILITTNLSLLIYDISDNHDAFSNLEDLEFIVNLLIWILDSVVQHFDRFKIQPRIITIFQEQCVQIAKSAKFLILNIPTQYLANSKSNLGAIASSILWQLVSDDETIAKHLLKFKTAKDLERIIEILDDQYQSNSVKLFKDSLQPIIDYCYSMKFQK